jgi:hypothetical protein
VALLAHGHPMTIEDAIAFVAEKHKGQPYKAGRPYI